MSAVTYEVSERVARITLNRPERGNGITRGLITELQSSVEWADLDPQVHVLLLGGNGKGFCGGYDLVESAEGQCSDLLMIAADAKIGYPPARVWGSPTTSMWAYRLGAQRAKRLLFTGDSLSGSEALEWGLAIEAPAPERLDERTETLVGRIARTPVNQLQMMKLLVNQSLHAQGLQAAQTLGTVLDGVARHTKEGYEFQGLAAREGFRAAVRHRDEPFGDRGASTFKG
jgi:enoyl-CoA hydratase